MNPLPARPVDRPSYVEAVDGSGFVSRFSSGATVRVTRSRARTYPGLACPAPPTIPFYRLALRDLAPGAVALDAGCGCGTHLAEIASRFETVIGVDVDDEAIAFARLHFSEARWVVANLTNLPPLGPVDAAFVVDVLGHGPYPFEVLRALHRVLAPHARLCVWEPAAYPSQTLIAPARRAFSRSSLRRLLLAAGFEPQDGAADVAMFVGFTATPVPEDGHDALLRASRAVEQGDAVGALAEIETARASRSQAVRAEADIAEGELRFACNDGDGACQCWFRALDLQPDDPRPLTGLSRIALALGESADALVFARKAYRLDPTDPAAACALAEATEQSSPTGSVQAWRRATDLIPSDWQVALRYARAASAAGDYQSSLHALERTLRYDPDVPEIHLELARALAAVGRHADARLELDLARTAMPDLPDIESLVRESVSDPLRVDPSRQGVPVACPPSR